METPSITFYKKKYSVSDSFCYLECLAHYTLENKSSKTCECQPDELSHNLIENNYKECSYPEKTKLMISKTNNAMLKSKANLSSHMWCLVDEVQ